MLGVRFHSSLFQIEEPIVLLKNNGRGRNTDLIERRNEKIAYRYYYHAYILKLHGWDNVLSALNYEFDLSEATLSKIITTVISDSIRHIFQEKPTQRELKQKFPHFNW